MRRTLAVLAFAPALALLSPSGLFSDNPGTAREAPRSTPAAAGPRGLFRSPPHAPTPGWSRTGGRAGGCTCWGTAWAGPSRTGGAARTLGLDLRLEAWGLAPEPGESLARFRRRFAEAERWWRSRDTALRDCSPEGARELNLRATEQTTRDPLSGRQVPEPGMSFLLYSLAAFIGGRGSDPDWWPNDGIVSTCSMDGPSLGSADGIREYDGVPRARPPGYASLPEFYAAIAGLLAGLPP